MKKKIKNILLLLFMGMLIIGGMEGVSELLYPTSDIVNNWRAFYAQEKNSLDYLIVGSSHAYSSFDVDMIEEELGKNTYILASPSQNVTQTYFNVKEALKYQKPEMIILETFGINNNTNWQNEDEETIDKNWKKEGNIDGMRLGIVKLEAIMAQYLCKNWPYAFFEIGRCHGNWKDVSLLQSNISFIKEGALQYQSFRPSTTQMSEDTIKKYEKMKNKKSEYQVSEVNKKYFYKLVELCRENNVELYMVMAPMYDGYIKKTNYNSRYEKMMEFSKNAGVEYLDCNKAYEEIGMIAQDFEDAYNSYHHLNHDGAKKVTSYLIEVLR